MRKRKNETLKKCHNCKGTGMVDGGASKAGTQPKLRSKCYYCGGTGNRGRIE